MRFIVASRNALISAVLSIPPGTWPGKERRKEMIRQAPATENTVVHVFFIPWNTPGFAGNTPPAHFRDIYTPAASGLHRWREKNDWEIQEDIESELGWSIYLDSDEISVAVKDGVATLVGMVDNLRDRRIATKNAYEGGARNVRNPLEVRNGPSYLWG